MANKIWNGILLGVAFAVLALFAAKNISSLSFISTFITSISTWLFAQSWMSWASTFVSYGDYIVAGVIGALIGGWVEYK